MLFVYIFLFVYYANAQNINQTECASAFNTIILSNYDVGNHPVFAHNYQCSDAPLLITFANTPQECSVHCDSTTGCSAFSYSTDCSSSVGSCNTNTLTCEDTKKNRCTLWAKDCGSNGTSSTQHIFYSFNVNASRSSVDMHYYYLPTFLHTAWEYGGITSSLANTYEFNKFDTIIVDDSEGIYKDQSVVEKDLTTTSESRMLTSCTLIKTLFGSLKPCFITIDTFTGAPETSSVMSYYKNAISLPEYSAMYNWTNADNSTFVYDLRYGSNTVRTMLNTLVTAIDHPVYLKNTFVGIENTWPFSYNKTTPYTPGPYDANYYDSTSYYWPPPDTVETFNLTDQYVNYILGKDLFVSMIGNDLNYIADYSPTEGVIQKNNYIDNCCNSETNVQLIANSTTPVMCRCRTDCSTRLREHMASFLMGIKANVHSYFSCQYHTELNKDTGDVRDNIPTSQVRNDIVRPPEFDQKLGVPQQHRDVNYNAVDVTFSGKIFRPFLSHSGVLQALAIWDKSNSSATTVCFKDYDVNNTACSESIQAMEAFIASPPTVSPSVAPSTSPTDLGNSPGGNTPSTSSHWGVQNFVLAILIFKTLTKWR